MSQRRTTPPKKPGKTAKWMTLSDLLWKIEKDYQEALLLLKAEKEETMRDVVKAYCPLPEPNEVIIADYTWRGQKFQYKDFRTEAGDVLIYGPTYRQDGTLSESRTAESLIPGDKIKLVSPYEEE